MLWGKRSTTGSKSDTSILSVPEARLLAAFFGDVTAKSGRGWQIGWQGKLLIA